MEPHPSFVAVHAGGRSAGHPARATHEVRAHRFAMIWIYALALVLTGFFALWPSRIMNKAVFGG